MHGCSLPCESASADPACDPRRSAMRRRAESRSSMRRSCLRESNSGPAKTSTVTSARSASGDSTLLVNAIVRLGCSTSRALRMSAERPLCEIATMTRCWYARLSPRASLAASACALKPRRRSAIAPSCAAKSELPLPMRMISPSNAPTSCAAAPERAIRSQTSGCSRISRSKWVPKLTRRVS